MRVGVPFFLGMAVIAVVTMVLHELVHAVVALALGAEAVGIGLTRMRYTGDLNSAAQAWVSISGPIFTATLGLIGAWLAIAKDRPLGYELLFVALFQRAAAMGMSHFTGSHNDEARVSLFLGWEWWMMPAALVVPLALLFVISAIRLRMGIGVFLLSYLTISLVYTGMVALDGQLPGGGPCSGIMVQFWPDAIGCAK